MKREVKISSFAEIQNLRDYARLYFDGNSILIEDDKGSIADARSILGLMSLDYSKPVYILAGKESEQAAETLIKSIETGVNHFEKLKF